MKTTTAGVHGDPATPMHCTLGHTFTVGTAYEDAHGEWCPECGEGAHSGDGTGCKQPNCRAAPAETFDEVAPVCASPESNRWQGRR